MQARVFVQVKTRCDEYGRTLTQNILLEDLYHRSYTGTRIIDISYPKHWGGLAGVLDTTKPFYPGLFSLARDIAYSDVEMNWDEWFLFVRFAEQTNITSIHTFKRTNLGVFESVEDFKQRYLIDVFVQNLDRLYEIAQAIDIDKLFDVIKEDIAVVPFKGKVVVFDCHEQLAHYLERFSY